MARIHIWRGIMLAAVLVAASPTPAAHAQAYVYKTARALFRDCSATGDVARRKRCAQYIGLIFDDWRLEQSANFCSRVPVPGLPDAYVGYWKTRGLGLLQGEFRSALSSVNDFLDSQRQPCPPAL